MTDKKISALNPRDPIDGTEEVVLETPGANWRSTLQNIFDDLGGSGATPGGSDTQVQFNDGGSALGGDPNFTWVGADGLAARKNALFGNFPTSGMFGYLRPGDPVNEIDTGQSYPVLSNNYWVGDLSTLPWEVAGIANFQGVKHTGSSSFWYYAFDNDVSVNSDSTGPISECHANYSAMQNYGTGNITHLTGTQTIGWNLAAATVTDLFGVEAQALCHVGTATNAIGVGALVQAQNSGTITNATGLRSEITKSSATITNAYGLDVKDCNAIGGTLSYNIVSRNAGYLGAMASTVGGNLFQGHSGVGNYADIDSIVFSPGDATNTFTQTVAAALSVNEFFSGDFGFDQPIANTVGLSSVVGFKHTGSELALSQKGASASLAISSDSTGGINLAVGCEVQTSNYGSGNFNFLMAGLSGFAYNLGSGTIPNLRGLNFDVGGSGSGNIGTGAGIRASAGNGGGTADWTACYGVSAQVYTAGTTGAVTTDAAALYAQTTDIFDAGTITNVYGLLLDDQTGKGTTLSMNMRSNGAASRNFFEGYVELQETASAPGTISNVARIFAQDNGAGKTQLMVQFGSGTAIQIAIEA